MWVHSDRLSPLIMSTATTAAVTTTDHSGYCCHSPFLLLLHNYYQFFSEMVNATIITIIIAFATTCLRLRLYRRIRDSRDSPEARLGTLRRRVWMPPWERPATEEPSFSKKLLPIWPLEMDQRLWSYGAIITSNSNT